MERQLNEIVEQLKKMNDRLDKLIEAVAKPSVGDEAWMGSSAYRTRVEPTTPPPRR